MLKHVSNDDFKKEVVENTKPVLVDFFASWCGPCSMLSPILEKVGSSTDDFDIAKINIDENHDLASEYSVEVIPTLFVFIKGKPVEKIAGLLNETQIVELMKKYI